MSAVGPVEKVVWATAVVTHNRTSRKSKRAQPHWTPLTCCVSPAMPLQIFALVRSSPLKSSCNLASFATTDRGGGKRRLVGTVKQCRRNGPRRVEMNSRSSVIETSRRALTASATVSFHWPQPLRLGPDHLTSDHSSVCAAILRASSSANGAKDRRVANVRCSVVFVQPLGHFATDRQIRQMVGRPRCAPQFDRSPPYPLANW